MAEPALGDAALKAPAKFLELRVHRLDLEPGLTGLCAGYELGQWRVDQFAGHLIEWIPEFALKPSERQAIGSSNMVRLLWQAARTIYTSEKYAKRGEFGELLLHAAIRQCFDTVPAISKIYYKDGPNDTVKGFDAVHVIDTSDALELWLGEAKFYDEVGRAIHDVVGELEKHMQRDYLRTEFQAIANKIDDGWCHAAKLRKLLDRNTSLDEVFRAACIPVLLTYDSPCIGRFQEVSEEFAKSFEDEVLGHHQTFRGKALPSKVRVHLVLVPLGEKKELVHRLHERLKACQSIM